MRFLQSAGNSSEEQTFNFSAKWFHVPTTRAPQQRFAQLAQDVY